MKKKGMQRNSKNWYSKAAENGSLKGMYKLGMFMKKIKKRLNIGTK